MSWYKTIIDMFVGDLKEVTGFILRENMVLHEKMEQIELQWRK